MNPNNEVKPPKKPLIFYYVIAILVVFLINALLMPSIYKASIREVSYSDFLDMLDAKIIEEAQIDDDAITFVATVDGARGIFTTGKIDDPNLVQNMRDAGVDFGKVIPQQNSPLLEFLLGWILPMVLFIAIGQLLMRQLTKRMGGGPGAMSFGKSNAKVYVAAQTGISFSDVAGEDEAKAALAEIVDFLHNPSKYTSIGAKLPKGVLLVGPPGTGKTLLAKAVAGEAHVPFFSISGSEFVEMFVGMGAARVRDLFKQAQEKAPCIVFIDEIDAIGKKRDNGPMGGNDEREQTLNQLLTEMDGFDGGKGVVILAATNRPESLDKALLRPGRFDRRVPVELPDLQGREAILKVHARNVKISSQVDWRSIALPTSGTWRGAGQHCQRGRAAGCEGQPATGGAARPGGGHRNRAGGLSAQGRGHQPGGKENRFLSRDWPCPGSCPPEGLRSGTENHHHSPHLRRVGLYHAGG